MDEDHFPDGWRIISEIFDPSRTLAVKRVIDFRNGQSWKTEFDYRTTPAPLVMPPPAVTHMRQRWKDDCGVCAVAMVAGVTWEDAELAMFPVNPDGSPRTKNTTRLTFASSDEAVIGGLRALGCDLPYARFIPIKDWADLRAKVITDYAILRFTGSRKERWHLTAFQGSMGFVFDPGARTERHYFGLEAPSDALVVRRG